MNRTPIITLEDTFATAIMKVGKGNPGATVVLMGCAEKAATVDPDNLMGAFAPILQLDSYGIYGSHIWILYKDICSENISKFIAILRAVQLGIISEFELHDGIGCQFNPNPMRMDVNRIVAEVKAELPNFKVEE